MIFSSFIILIIGIIPKDFWQVRGHLFRDPACRDFFADTLLVGDMMIVDDYGVKTCEGTKRTVGSFAGEENNFIKFQMETPQCLLIRMG